MNLDELKSQVALGEDSRRQFKQEMTNADALAAEMAAFSNTEGGVIYLGVADDGGLPGLSRADVSRLNQLIANTASQHIRSLRKIQARQGVNAPGVPEIPPSVFEELLVNALMHRDYLISAPIRLFVFDNRIEIISPGHLPNNLTVPKIRAGNSNIRNPILVSYVAKGMLPYRGLGSGIKRALGDWPDIDFTDDREGNLFVATVHRKASGDFVDTENSASQVNGSPKSSPKSSPKTDEQIVALLSQDATISTEKIGQRLDITKRAVLKQIQKLKMQGRLRRIGPARGGHWEVVG